MKADRALGLAVSVPGAKSRILARGSAQGWLSLALIATLELGGCASPGSALAPLPSPGALESSYVLGAGDRIQIVLYGTDEANTQYTVSDAGMIGAPLIGPVKAAGMTVAQLQGEIRDRLAQGYVEDPKLSVEVIAYRPFFVLGAVTKPGAYPFAPGTTIQSAVATAGGYTYRADESFAVIDRKIDKTVAHGRSEPSDMVLPGDIIRISERYF
ncbi:MAG TPA: polysaccharide biosynthesis/export family protein [Bradyrhizobium sp.]|nr:polysaccharide biosynthesis/export family protein [Bradyrhizobium sp.]